MFQRRLLGTASLDLAPRHFLGALVLLLAELLAFLFRLLLVLLPLFGDLGVIRPTLDLEVRVASELLFQPLGLRLVGDQLIDVDGFARQEGHAANRHWLLGLVGVLVGNRPELLLFLLFSHGDLLRSGWCRSSRRSRRRRLPGH